MAAIEETVCMVKHLKLFSTLFTCKRCQNCSTFVLLTMNVCREQCKMLSNWEVLSNLAVMRETDATKATLSSERKPGIKLVCAKSISFGVSAMCVKLESITISANVIDYRQQHSLNSGLFRLCQSCLISSIGCNSSYKRQLRGIKNLLLSWQFFNPELPSRRRSLSSDYFFCQFIILHVLFWILNIEWWRFSQHVHPVNFSIDLSLSQFLLYMYIYAHTNLQVGSGPQGTQDLGGVLSSGWDRGRQRVRQHTAPFLSSRIVSHCLTTSFWIRYDRK